MIDERADGIGIAKIHAQSDAGISESVAVVIRHIDRVAQERLVYRYARPIDHHEMYLMDVKSVEFSRAVLNDPIFDISLFHHNIWNAARWVKGRWRLAIFGDEKRGRAVWIVGVEQFFGEVQTTSAHRDDVA